MSVSLEGAPAEAVKDVSDFTASIDTAKLHAIVVDARSATDQQQIRPVHEQDQSAIGVLEPYREKPDGYTINFADTLDDPHMITAPDPEQYWTLFRQTLGLPLDKPGDEVLEKLAAEQYQHEIEHAAEAEKIPGVKIVYAMGFFRTPMPDGEDQYFARPSIVPLGSLKKIEYAMIVAAPTHPSPDDVAALKKLGYSSAEEVRARYANFSLRDL